MRTTPYANLRAEDRPDFFAEPLLRRTAIIWISGFESALGLNFLYEFLAAVTTALGIYGPEEWPPLFGAFTKDAWSVRQLWG